MSEKYFNQAQSRKDSVGIITSIYMSVCILSGNKVHYGMVQSDN